MGSKERPAPGNRHTVTTTMNVSQALLSLTFLLSSLQPATARRGGGGFRGGGRGGGFFGGSRTSSSRSSSGYRGSSSSRYNSYNSYSGGYGRSSSSGGFGLGLGGGLLLGYSLSRPGFAGYGYGHNNYNYRRRSNYDTTRPISCYKADLTKEITGDVELEEELVTCNQVEDVCFGKVVLTVSNQTDTGSSQGYIQVTKGCGIRSGFEAELENAKFDSVRECFVTELETNNKVINNNYKEANQSLLSETTSTTTTTSVQQELCICEGSKCNSGNILGARTQAVLTFSLLVLWIIPS